jgi:hypothetical protein
MLRDGDRDRLARRSGAVGVGGIAGAITLSFVQPSCWSLLLWVACMISFVFGTAISGMLFIRRYR